MKAGDAVVMREPTPRELDQFTLLSRDSVRSLLDAAVLARGADPAQFAVWGVVLVSLPPTLFAFREMLRYSALRFAPAAVIEQMIQIDRLFFLVYGMLAAALLATVTWEALLPDRADQEIIGMLPVRARTFAAARLAAALYAAGAVSATISVPAAILLAVAAPSHPALGFMPVVLIAHIVSTMSAGLFVFVVLLIARAAFAVCLGARVSERLGMALQLLTIAGLAEVFLFTAPAAFPSALPALARRVIAGDPTVFLLPPVPFAALYSWIVGARYPLLGVEAAVAPLALVAAVSVVIPLYLYPARLLARRAVESQRRPHAGLVSSCARAAACVLPSSPAMRSMVIFTIATILRSRRHRLIVNAYLGIALAVGTTSLLAAGIRGTIAFDAPAASLLSLPLVLMFFLTLGLRAAFAMPADVDASWTFRLSQPPVMAAIDATAITMLLVSSLPVAAAASACAAALGWTGETVVLIGAFDLLSGVLLVEFALRDWRKIPFACAHLVDPESLRSRWLGQIVPLILFAFANGALQKVALRSLTAAMWYAGVAIGALALLRVRRRLAARAATLQFDASLPDSMATLSLSGALN